MMLMLRCGSADTDQHNSITNRWRRNVTRTILNMAEVAEMTGTSIDTLRYWRATGKGGPPSYRLGRRVVYDQDAVAAWLNEQRQKTLVSG